jgi:hypothetical protein
MTRVLGQYLTIISGPKVNKSKGHDFEDPGQEGKRPRLIYLSIDKTLGAILWGGQFSEGQFEVYTLCNLKPWSCANTMAKIQPRLTCLMQISDTDFD